MQVGICTLSFIPVRKEPSHRSEMVTQLLFGELYSVSEIKEGWILIKSEYDNYEGWIDDNQFQNIDREEFLKLKETKPFFPQLLFSPLNVLKENTALNICFGSHLPAKQTFSIGLNNYLFDCEIFITEGGQREQLIQTAHKFLNVPYLWGGKTPFGIDCSGFTQVVYKTIGVNLLRDASQQASQGKDVGFVSEALPGDLAFFGTNESITHVGFILGDQKILHTSGKVRIDKIDHHGIFNLEAKKYTHKLRLIKSYLD